MKLIKISIPFILIITIILYGLNQEKLNTIPGINISYMDTLTKPSKDFFRYVNGTWLDSTTIPDDRTTWGSFSELRKKTDEDALNILKAAMSNNEDLKKIDLIPGSDQEKAVFLFETIMDTISRNNQGISPILPYLEKVKAIKNISDLQNYLIEMEPLGGGGFFDFGVGSDPKNSNRNVGYLGAGGLGLPDRDYYIKNDEDSKNKRNLYVKHITKMLQYLGDDKVLANKQAEQILALETRLAESMMDKVDRRDARKRYNPKSIDQLQKMIPLINWESYFTGIGVNQKGDSRFIHIDDIESTQKRPRPWVWSY